MVSIHLSMQVSLFFFSDENLSWAYFIPPQLECPKIIICGIFRASIPYSIAEISTNIYI